MNDKERIAELEKDNAELRQLLARWWIICFDAMLTEEPPQSTGSLSVSPEYLEKIWNGGPKNKSQN